MKQNLDEKISFPEGTVCKVENGVIICTKGANSLQRPLGTAEIEASVENNELSLKCARGNKKQLNVIRSLAAHVRNMIVGLDKKFSYTLEACNVHFPMTLKLDGNKLIINNFLGEKTPRFAYIPEGVHVEIKGLKITLTSHDREKAGQAMANIEYSTKVRKRDRRVFQDGIYLVERPGRNA